MRILSLDTASPFPSLALEDGSGRALARPLPPNAAEALPSAVRSLLAEARLSVGDLERVAVLSGPGSFTGLRAGLAFARGLARALAIPLVLVPTFAAADEAVPAPADALFVLDAGRGDVLSVAREGGDVRAAESPRPRTEAEAGARARGWPVIDLGRSPLPLAAAASRLASQESGEAGRLDYGRESAAEEKWARKEAS
jgi:tRNA threonylcarbamoyl adenosine modification protein YeaZ